jgi:glycosyltransferase involved in cell wall biosynthesis
MKGRSLVPSVSVCVPLYRKEKYIAETLSSVLKQTFGDFELIVLDNASPDRSAEIARSFDDPRVTVMANPTTVSPVENFNKVVSLSHAPLVKVLCADDLLHPDCLERQMSVIADDKSLAMVSSRMNMIDEVGNVVSRDRCLRTPDLIGHQERAAVIRRLVRHGGNPVGGPNNVVFRRDAFDASGGFPEDVDFFAADVGLWVRLLEHGDYYGIGETLSDFRINSGSHSSSMGGRAIGIQHEFVAGLRRDNSTIVRPSDRLFGALRAPLTRLRHHMLFAAAGPADSTSRRLASRLLGIGHKIRPVEEYPPR